MSLKGVAIRVFWLELLQQLVSWLTARPISGKTAFPHQWLHSERAGTNTPLYWSDVADGFYVFGGQDGGSWLNEVYVYHPEPTTTTVTLTTTTVTSTSATSSTATTTSMTSMTTTRTEDRVDRSDNWIFLKFHENPVVAPVYSVFCACRMLEGGLWPRRCFTLIVFGCPCSNLRALDDLDGTKPRYGSRMKFPWTFNKHHQTSMGFTITMFHCFTCRFRVVLPQNKPPNARQLKKKHWCPSPW